MKKSPQSAAEGARPNASTGPRSAEGKARSSMNALKTGIYAKSLTIPSEDPKQLTTLTEEYFERFHPTLPEQSDLVDILVRSTWTLRRLAVAEAQVYAHEMDRANHLDEDSPVGHAFCLSDRTLSRLQRMVNSTQRNFRDALRELEHLRALDSGARPSPGPESPHANPGPTFVPDPHYSQQPVDTKPVSPSQEFVPSPSSPPSPTAPKAPPKPPQKRLPFHHAGAPCSFDPIDRQKYKRCPTCFPDDCYPDAQE